MINNIFELKIKSIICNLQKYLIKYLFLMAVKCITYNID